jgi:glycosyltransferase involved in cell wall biosynthesis
MAREKTLIILTPGFPQSDHDTTCLPLQQAFVRAIGSSGLGVRVYVIAFHYPHSAGVYTCAGADVQGLGGRNRGGPWTWFRNRQVEALVKILRRDRNVIGLLSFWHGECAAAGERLARKTGLPHYCWLMGQDARSTNRYPQPHPVAAKNLVALSDSLRDEYEANHGVRPSRVIVPGVDTKLFNVSTKPRDIDVLAVGSLIPLKRFEVVLEIVKKLKGRRPHLNAVIIGEGPCRQEVDAWLTQWGLSQNVTLAGELAYRDVLEHMKRAKVLLHPSSYEGFSGVCLEAVCAGAHVVSFCRPMQSSIPQWHIADSVSQMLSVTSDLLSGKVDFLPNKDFVIGGTASEVLALFQQVQVSAPVFVCESDDLVCQR